MVSINPCGLGKAEGHHGRTTVDQLVGIAK